MTKRQKKLVTAAAALALCLGILPAANAMHIMEGALPVRFCIAWGVVCIPFLLAGFFSIRKTLNANRRALTLLAMSGAFIFVISSLKIPSVSGSSSHMTGTGLGAILFGPSPVAILGTDRADFPGAASGPRRPDHPGSQHLFHGGGRPFVTFGLFWLLKKLKVNRKVSIFLAAFVGDLFTYCITAFQLALAHNSATNFGVALKENLVIFAGTQIPWPRWRES